jgi:hypothetical protein
LLVRIVAQLNQRLQSHVRIAQIRDESSDLAQATILSCPPVLSNFVLCQTQRCAQFFEMLADLMHGDGALLCWVSAQFESGMDFFAENSLQPIRQRLAHLQAIAHILVYSVASRTLL